jgi:hypothetical protein
VEGICIIQLFFPTLKGRIVYSIIIPSSVWHIYNNFLMELFISKMIK